MKQIAIYGAGGFGREVACIINAVNKVKPSWHLLGFFDDGRTQGTSNYYGNVIGDLKVLNSFPSKLGVVIAIASPQIIEELSQKITNTNIYFPNIIAPDVLLFDENAIEWGHGNVVGFGVRISCGVKIGSFNILNGCVSLGHDDKIGNYNVMQPDTRISGEVTIGNKNFFGARSLVLQGLQIGNNTRIGAGSVVLRNTKDGMLYFGNPAKLYNDGE